jgi:hypothetical protein
VPGRHDLREEKSGLSYSLGLHLPTEGPKSPRPYVRRLLSGRSLIVFEVVLRKINTVALLAMHGTCLWLTAWAVVIVLFCCAAVIQGHTSPRLFIWTSAQVIRAIFQALCLATIAHAIEGRRPLKNSREIFFRHS